MKKPPIQEVSRFLVTLPVWTIIHRHARTVTTPTIKGIEGPLFPMFTEEAFADEAVESMVDVDPYPIRSLDQLRRLLQAFDAAGCRWVAIDAGLRRSGGLLFSIADVLRSIQV